MSNWNTVPNIPSENVECRFCGMIVGKTLEEKLGYHTTLTDHIKLINKQLEEEL